MTCYVTHDQNVLSATSSTVDSIEDVNSQEKRSENLLYLFGTPVHHDRFQMILIALIAGTSCPAQRLQAMLMPPHISADGFDKYNAITNNITADGNCPK